MTIDISRIDRNSLDLAIKDALVAAKECHSHRKYLNDNNRLGWCCHTYFMKIPTNITIKYLTEKMAYEIAVSRRPTLSPWILGGQEICPWTKLTALKHFCRSIRSAVASRGGCRADCTRSPPARTGGPGLRSRALAS